MKALSEIAAKTGRNARSQAPGPASPAPKALSRPAKAPFEAENRASRRARSCISPVFVPNPDRCSKRSTRSRPAGSIFQPDPLARGAKTRARAACCTRARKSLAHDPPPRMRPIPCRFRASRKGAIGKIALCAATPTSKVPQFESRIGARAPSHKLHPARFPTKKAAAPRQRPSAPNLRSSSRIHPVRPRGSRSRSQAGSRPPRR